LLPQKYNYIIIDIDQFINNQFQYLAIMHINNILS